MDGPGRQIRQEAEAARAHPQVAAGLARLIAQLCDIGEGRVADMDAAGLDLQVLSLTAPGVEQLDPVEAVALARDTNDTARRGAGAPALPPPDTAALGWHVDTAVHVLRLILSGALDRYPRLQLVIGHLGEALPMLPRLERALPTELTRLDRPVGAYLWENVHYTFSGFNWTPAFLDLLLQVGPDRIVFSTDHPYASMTRPTPSWTGSR